MSLDGKVVIVTGASRGIGKAAALGFAREGAKVVVGARTDIPKDRIPGTIHETVAQIAAMGGQALAVRVDVADEESVNEMVRRTIAQFGRVDVLVNNAAGAFYKPVADTPSHRWDIVVNVNLRGSFLCSKAVLQYMIPQQSGSIINLSSRAAELAGPSFVGLAYCASKAGVERFTTGLAEEVRQYNVAVNVVKPRWIIGTEGMRMQNPEADKSDWDDVDDFMIPALKFLASQDASGVTGGNFTDEEVCRRHQLL